MRTLGVLVAVVGAVVLHGSPATAETEHVTVKVKERLTADAAALAARNIARTTCGHSGASVVEVTIRTRARRFEEAVPCVEVATTTTTRIAPTRIVPIPDDPVLAECQAVVNEALAEWTFDDDLRTRVECVPASRLDGDHTGEWHPQLAVVNAETVPTWGNELRSRRFRSTAAHELGHAWDFANLQEREHARYMAIRGYTGTWRDSKAAEDYADVFALLTSGLGVQTMTGYLGTPGFISPGKFADRPTDEQIAAICAERLVPCAT